jgi:hypothetical protein
MSCILKFTHNKISWALIFLHIMCVELPYKFINVLLQNSQIKEILGIRLYLNFTMTYVPADYTLNTGYIFLLKYIYVYCLKIFYIQE